MVFVDDEVRCVIVTFTPVKEKNDSKPKRKEV